MLLEKMAVAREFPYADICISGTLSGKTDDDGKVPLFQTPFVALRVWRKKGKWRTGQVDVTYMGLNTQRPALREVHLIAVKLLSCTFRPCASITDKIDLSVGATAKRFVFLPIIKRRCIWCCHLAWFFSRFVATRRGVRRRCRCSWNIFEVLVARFSVILSQFLMLRHDDFEFEFVINLDYNVLVAISKEYPWKWGITSRCFAKSGILITVLDTYLRMGIGTQVCQDNTAFLVDRDGESHVADARG